MEAQFDVQESNPSGEERGDDFEAQGFYSKTEWESAAQQLKVHPDCIKKIMQLWDSVVLVSSSAGCGTGFLIDAPGIQVTKDGVNSTITAENPFLVVTNRHVVPEGTDPKDIELHFFKDARGQQGVVVLSVLSVRWVSPETSNSQPLATVNQLDFVVLEFRFDEALRELTAFSPEDSGRVPSLINPKFLKFAGYDTPTSPCCIIGHPRGSYKRISFGYFQQSEFDDKYCAMQHNVETRPGNSGSPVLVWWPANVANRLYSVGAVLLHYRGTLGVKFYEGIMDSIRDQLAKEH